MRIGLVLPRPPGWSETFFNTKIRVLREAGHEVVLFPQVAKSLKSPTPIFRAPRLSRHRGLRMVQVLVGLTILFLRAPGPAFRFWRLERCAGRSRRKALQSLYLNSHLLPHRLDWLHFGFATMGLGREQVGRAIRARTGVSLRGYDLNQSPLGKPRIYHLLWKHVDRVHTLSDALLQRASQLGLAAEMPVMRIPPALDMDLFMRQSPIDDLGDPLRILTMARLHWIKGMEYCLEALALLKKEGMNVRYKLIGSGGDYERLVYAVHQLGLREDVSFQDKIPHAAVPREMEASDLYLQYSLQEGFGNAVLEAQALGLLCIVSDAGGLTESVMHGETGWVVPGRCPRRLARQIRAVIEMSREEREAVRRQAMQRVKQGFSLEGHRRQWNAFFTDEN
jgi:colanic acid/amylovoran biosynthesis glycosyltransferase